MLGHKLPGWNCLATCCLDETAWLHVAWMRLFGYMLPGWDCLATYYCCILICRFMHKHNNTAIKTSDTVLRKIYLSLYWKGCVREGVGDRTKLQHIDPTLLAIIAFLFRSPGVLNWGPGGKASLGHVLTPASSGEDDFFSSIWTLLLCQ